MDVLRRWNRAKPVETASISVGFDWNLKYFDVFRFVLKPKVFWFIFRVIVGRAKLARPTLLIWNLKYFDFDFGHSFDRNPKVFWRYFALLGFVPTQNRPTFSSPCYARRVGRSHPWAPDRPWMAKSGGLGNCVMCMCVTYCWRWWVCMDNAEWMKRTAGLMAAACGCAQTLKPCKTRRNR